jgi:hypothetical protein
MFCFVSESWNSHEAFPEINLLVDFTVVQDSDACIKLQPFQDQARITFACWVGLVG